MDNPKERGYRIAGGLIILLIILFVVIDFFLRRSTEFSPSNVTNILLYALQIIVLLLALILLFVLGRNLTKLYLERRRKVVGAHFKIKLVLFFTALSFIPTLLLFLFTSNLINRNIEQWFKPDFTRILNDTKEVADGFYVMTSETNEHYSTQLGKEVRRQDLLAPENRGKLEDLVRTKLTEYRLDEVGIFLEKQELFSYYNPNLPFQDYQELSANAVQRAHLGEPIRERLSMGAGEFVRSGISIPVPPVGNLLVVTGKFLPKNYAQKITALSSFIERYRTRKPQDLAKTLYLLLLIFVTMLIVFAAVWIGFHIAKSITVPIEKLAQAAKEVSKGNLAVKVDDPASDEIGLLIDAFNQMISDVKDGRQATDQKTAELEARKQYIETILNTINTGVITVAGDGTIATINPSARDMLALPADGGAGRPYREVLGRDRYRDVTAAIDAAVKSRHRIADKELQLQLDGQQTTIAMTLTPLRGPGPEFAGMIVVLDDLTQLIKAQKIAAWKEVAQRVAHEIKNPLTPIQLNAERILKNLKRTEPGGGEVVEQGARVIIQEAQTIKALVDEFSDFARLPKINLQPAGLRDIIGQVVAMFRGIFADVEFEVAVESGVPATQALDPEQMKRVFINLIDNAIDAMNKKGKITLRATFDREANQVNIEVSDSGPGIPLEDKDKLFLPHFSTKKKGTGLGLAIVNQIIKEHNGTVQVTNGRPSGARFVLQLPA
jgi:two-component system nitrogen regulation sensor histidine kinase NtrY